MARSLDSIVLEESALVASMYQCLRWHDVLVQREKLHQTEDEGEDPQKSSNQLVQEDPSH